MPQKNIVEQKVASDRIYNLKSKFKQKLEELCLARHFSHAGRPQVVTLAKLLSSNHCERQINYLLDNPELVIENKSFDSFYREKSEYATLLIVDHLKMSLGERGVNVSIRTEDRSDFGICDVTIENGNPCRVFLHGIEKVRLEIKASLGIPLEQIGRYLYDDSTLIVGRIITNHVAVLRPSEHQNFVLFSLQAMLAKVQRLLEGKEYTVPGKYCSYCLDFDCPFNRNKGKGPARSQLVTMDDREFGRDIESFFGNIKDVSEKIASLVIAELRKDDAHGLQVGNANTPDTSSA
jgi:hypothetical protein